MAHPALDADLARELDALSAAGLRRRVAPLAEGCVNFSGNDYLGLARHPAVLAAAAAPYTAGAGAARLVGADSIEHTHLETQLAAFKGLPAALLFSTGYHANLAALATLAHEDDAIFSDALNHASLIDGCRLSRATTFVYRHLDTAHLAEQLAHAARYRRRLIVTDAVFGMDGDVAPLRALAQLAETFDALLVVDEAHATGVLGPRGQGLCAACGIVPDVQITTFGKALGTFGAAVLGSSTLVDYLTNRARPFIFTTALPPALCAATTAAIDVLRSPQGDVLRATLDARHAQLTTGLARLGHPIERPTPIIPLLVGDAHQALALSAALREQGLFVQAIRPPTVPPATSRLRIALSAAHQVADVERLLAVLSSLLPKVAR